MKSDDRGGYRLPLLPLRDIIVFPHMVVPLFVGRQKSIRALEEAMNKQKFILLAAQKASWGPIQHAGDLHDRATYRYFWELVQRARLSGQKLPPEAEEAFFTA